MEFYSARARLTPKFRLLFALHLRQSILLFIGMMRQFPLLINHRHLAFIEAD